MIVVAELWTGVKKNLTRPQHAARLADFLSPFPIVDFNLGAAHHYAEIRADLEAGGTPIGPFDLLIAVQARSIAATLVTANAAEFRCVKGLKLLAWRPSKS
ncbi:type II toxin-antitoxin system VapC family toxin [Haloferula sp. BvORR071]|uniref:type II toxin-antitoxin system VapC family toxin n=1 Tax=Haloferula sp. BvORR071 TaxID=1396141 RepID=UPI000696DDFF|nr:type II toxin-antitoxin system VapC family toxin [Haloferula sp. BvORR071]